MLHAIRRLLLRVIGVVFSRPAPRSSVRRVLVIKPDHLGDVLLLLPALRALRDTLPDAHITLLIGPWAAPALRGSAVVDAVQFCSFPGFTRAPKPNWLQPYGELLRMGWLLRAESYDTAIIARDDHWWGALLALLADIPRRVGHSAPDVGPLLTDQLPYDSATHVAVQSLELVAALSGVPVSEYLPQAVSETFAPCTSDDLRWAASWLIKHDVQRDTRFVAIHPGAGGTAKLWVVARWAMVAEALMDDGWRVVLTGGANRTRSGYGYRGATTKAATDRRGGGIAGPACRVI